MICRPYLVLFEYLVVLFFLIFQFHFFLNSFNLAQCLFNGHWCSIFMGATSNDNREAISSMVSKTDFLVGASENFDIDVRNFHSSYFGLRCIDGGSAGQLEGWPAGQLAGWPAGLSAGWRAGQFFFLFCLDASQFRQSRQMPSDS